jgi:WD40 repeat protein
MRIQIHNTVRKYSESARSQTPLGQSHRLVIHYRNLKEEVQTFRGHKKEASAVAWHPIHEGAFASGGSDGSIFFWSVGAEKEIGVIEQVTVLCCFFLPTWGFLYWPASFSLSFFHSPVMWIRSGPNREFFGCSFRIRIRGYHVHIDLGQIQHRERAWGHRTG